MTRPDLDALAALLDKATPGSLKAYWKGAGGWTIAWGSVFAFDIRACGCKKEDTALIVAAVNALPGIIARVRELERERDDAALAMRERCAKACEEIARSPAQIDDRTDYVADDCAAAIRALET